MELLYGSLRYYFSLSTEVRAHLSRPLRKKDSDLFALLIVGAYQLRHMRIPDHAAINETVGAVTLLKKPWAKGLVNAVLRQIARETPSKVSTDHSFELPDWISERLSQDFPEHAEAVARASVERAPMSLRVNVRRVSVGDYGQLLDDAGIEFHSGNFAEHLILDSPVPVRDLPGYAQGIVSVQDAGAQFAAHLNPPGMREAPRILDACVAPGGKLFHLAERFPQATLVGIELSRDRLAHVQQEAARLGHENVQLIGGDATGRDWLSKLAAGDGDAARFDLILLDAPCSGSGTLRRHPDIKLLRTEQDVSAAAELQLALLENLWPLLAEGGSLIYCTCSVFTEENDQVVEAFIRRLQQEAAPTLDRLDLPVGIATRFGWQLLPLPADETPPNRSVDGFYFARMTRREKAR